MFRLININLIGDKERDNILKTSYRYIPSTYEEYFKKYGNLIWSFDKFQSKAKVEYPLSLLCEENGGLIFHQGISQPKLIDKREFLKIGFWIFREKNESKNILKKGITFLEGELPKRYESPTLFLEVPSDFEPVVRFYEEDLSFKVCSDSRRINIILKEFGRRIKNQRQSDYTTENTDIYQCILLKDI
jgi:hypothetical protein